MAPQGRARRLGPRDVRGAPGCAASEEEFERLCAEEQAKVDLFRKPLKDAAEPDLWPRHLYWGGI